MLRGILFDFNGVLLDDERLHFDLFREILAEEGVELDERAYYRELVHFDDEAGFRHALYGPVPGSEVEPARIEELCKRKAERYLERIEAAGYPLFSGAADLVDAAHRDGLFLGIVSGALRAEIEPALRHAGLFERFAGIVAADDVERSKPDPEGYRAGLRILERAAGDSLDGRHVLAIEDTDGGIRAAAGAGLRTLAVAHTLPASRLLDADHVVESLARVHLADLRSRFVGNEGAPPAVFGGQSTGIER